jgi:hypothetical protein
LRCKIPCLRFNQPAGHLPPNEPKAQARPGSASTGGLK